jgi:hypothetical protein
MKMRNVFSVFLVLFILSSCEKEKVIPASELPSEIKEYVSIHFPGHAIVKSVKEKEAFTKNYEVSLEGNFKLEFNKKNEIVEIDGVSKLPDSVIPEKIRAYVSENYPTNYITDWELEGKNQKVELDNGLDLEFTMNGDFIRIDD